MSHSLKFRSLITPIGLTILLFGISCESNQSKNKLTEQEVACSWAELTIYITRHTPSNSPTFASRAFAYIGLTMYESIVWGYDNYNSLEGTLTDFENLPHPIQGANYNWVLALNAAEAHILKNIYIQTSGENKSKIDSLEFVIKKQFSADVDKEVISRSIEFGQAIASAIFEWSKTDGGHRGYLTNFDKNFKVPYKPGGWEPPLYGQTFSHLPLHPYWGKNRNFVRETSQMTIPSMIQYDTSKQSEYYKQFLSVYEKSKSLSKLEKEIALWWNDDPNETFTPPGHSYHLALNVVRREQPPLIKCAETFARVGLAVGDAFINCWKWKYHFLSERPFSFITRNIDASWESFWPDPPFPAFPSGHATQSSAAVTVLIDLYGEKIHVTDSTHASRPIDELRHVGFVPRNFDSLWHISVETANSRFYGGIHSAQDNNVGLEQGKKIGENVNRLSWHE